MTTEATMQQLSIFDELDSQDRAARAADTTLAGYHARYERGELIPGESCPACGTVLPGRYDGSQSHGLVTDEVCVGMDLTRRHLAIALSDDPQWQGMATGDEDRAAITAGWPEATVRAWQADPSALAQVLKPATRSDRTADTKEG
ncbi:hypothetical protein Bra3105_18490 (plasmid) [Brachybacterium halotolerans subsp. kimchii]|uniref:hypothetical protein n=1 Tax=Brachybacterium halotolerans TaxID=2795215 RepID=UPI001E36B37E|nr:hypothetical protein [Brachybacterium halotolerans]UEJ84621.1 hypothetical protein Bra3105_18490 [Brachybacterium halotolerans subsp. kimchii]